MKKVLAIVLMMLLICATAGAETKVTENGNTIYDVVLRALELQLNDHVAVEGSYTESDGGKVFCVKFSYKTISTVTWSILGETTQQEQLTQIEGICKSVYSPMKAKADESNFELADCLVSFLTSDGKLLKAYLNDVDVTSMLQ